MASGWLKDIVNKVGTFKDKVNVLEDNFLDERKRFKNTFEMLWNGRFLYTNEQNFGGKQLIEELQERLGLSYQDIYLMLSQATLTDPYNTEILTPFKQSIVRQAQRSLQYFVSSSSTGIECIVLAGGCAAIQNIDKLIENHAGIPVYIANPFINMSLSPEINRKNLSGLAPAMMINCGLALRSFELWPELIYCPGEKNALKRDNKTLLTVYCYPS